MPPLKGEGDREAVERSLNDNHMHEHHEERKVRFAHTPHPALCATCLAATWSGAALGCHRQPIHSRAPASQPPGEGRGADLRSVPFIVPPVPPQRLPSCSCHCETSAHTGCGNPRLKRGSGRSMTAPVLSDPPGCGRIAHKYKTERTGGGRNLGFCVTPPPLRKEVFRK